MRNTIATILKWQTTRLIKKVQPIIVGVTGSVGKTSTTQAIATVLQGKFVVRKTYGNYNTDIGIPCSIFEQKIPTRLSNPVSWLVLLIQNEMSILTSKKHIFDVAVLELGTDSIGEIASYAWLKPDLAVVTAVAPEHMEIFGDLDTVASEELAVISYSKEALLNENMIDKRFVDTNGVKWYSGSTLKKEYRDAVSSLHGEHSFDAVAAAVYVAEIIGLNEDEIITGLSNIKAQPGRMNQLEGIKDSILIDDTYNSSPEAVRAALRYLNTCSGVKVALLGNMNELGDSSAQAHTSIGKQCDPKVISLVVTLGVDANRYTAKAAKENGCEVIKTNSPYEAGEFIRDFILNSDSEVTVLCKGSQNGVYAEEAVKILLKNTLDSQYLVRQSDSWLRKKENTFKKVSK